MKTNEHYVITIDLPSMTKDDVILTRSNMTTIVKGKRKKTLGQDLYEEHNAMI